MIQLLPLQGLRLRPFELAATYAALAAASRGEDFVPCFAAPCLEALRHVGLLALKDDHPSAFERAAAVETYAARLLAVAVPVVAAQPCEDGREQAVEVAALAASGPADAVFGFALAAWAAEPAAARVVPEQVGLARAA